MAQAFTAQIRAWSEKAKRNAGLVVASAAQDVFKDMSQRQESVKETGGSFLVGKVPVDDGILIGSMFFQLNGTTTATGTVSGRSSTPPDYVASLVGFGLGDIAQLAFSAEYARAMEYGTASISGRFFVRGAVNGGGGWQSRVDTAAARFKD